MKYNIRLTMKAIIRAEQVLRKPFTEIDYTNKDDLLKLLYCVVLVNNQEMFTYEEFLLLTDNEKQLTTMMKEVEKVNLVLSQFIIPEKNGSNDSCGEPQYLKDTIALLIMCGLDAGYAMNEMELSDVPLYVKACDNKRREEMEAGRLWAFLTAAPHIDTKKIKSPEDYFSFPWEVAQKKIEAEKSIDRDKEMFEKFLDEGMNIFNN